MRSAAPYTVTATLAGTAAQATFDLTNLVALTFSGLSNPSITFGTPSTTLTGKLSSGSQAPQGQKLLVSLGSAQQSVTVGSGGTFSATFDTAGLAVTALPYPIAYIYTTDGVYGSASASGALTVTPANPTVNVTDSSGTYNNTAFPATATVAGIDGTPGTSLEGISPTLTYYSGTYTSPAQLNGLTALPVRRPRPVPIRCSPASPAAPTTAAPRTWRISRSPRPRRR